MSRPVPLVLMAVVACHAAPAVRPKLPLVTAAEQSGFVRTGHYAEAIALCRDFARAYDGVRCDEIGRTFEDRPIVALHIARHHAHPVPVLYLQAGVHAGEIDG